MNRNPMKGEYLAPKVKVVEMQTRQHILTGSDYYSPAKDDTSHDGTEGYDTGNASGWF